VFLNGINGFLVEERTLKMMISQADVTSLLLRGENNACPRSSIPSNTRRIDTDTLNMNWIRNEKKTNSHRKCQM